MKQTFNRLRVAVRLSGCREQMQPIARVRSSSHRSWATGRQDFVEISQGWRAGASDVGQGRPGQSLNPDSMPALKAQCRTESQIPARIGRHPQWSDDLKEGSSSPPAPADNSIDHGGGDIDGHGVGLLVSSASGTAWCLWSNGRSENMTWADGNPLRKRTLCRAISGVPTPSVWGTLPSYRKGC